MARKPGLGQAELEVLRFIADAGDSPVRIVADHFADTHGWVRPTVFQMMERLRKKGFLARELKEGVYHYSSVDASGDLEQKLVDGFVKNSLRGSVSPVVAYLVSQDDLSAEDVAQLRSLVDELEKKERKRS